jgi:hypothetical protein
MTTAELTREERRELARRKEQISLRVQGSVVQYFRDLSETRDTPYLSLMARALREAMLRGWDPDAEVEAPLASDRPSEDEVRNALDVLRRAALPDG